MTLTEVVLDAPFKTASKWELKPTILFLGAMQVNQSIHRAALYSAACDGENRQEHYTDNKNSETEHKVCKLKYFREYFRELMQQRRRWLRKRHLKSYVALLKIYRDYSNSINSSNVGNFCFWSWIVKDCIEVQEKKKKVVVLCSSPPQNVEFHVVVVQWRQSNVQKSVMHVQIWFFCPI